MPYSEEEIKAWWLEIEKAAGDAPESPYSHAKVNELIRVAWALKQQNLKLQAALDEAVGLLEWAQSAFNDRDRKLVSHYPSGSGWKRKVDAFLAAQGGDVT